jgi:hypothetical protein
MTVATTVGIKWPGPYQVSVTLERPEPRARKTRPSKGATTDQLSRSPLSESRHRIGTLHSRGLLISNSWAGSTANPRVVQMQKVGGTQLPPRNGPTDQGFEA